MSSIFIVGFKQCMTKRKPLTFREDPNLVRFQATARVLDFLWGLPLPWRRSLFIWVAFLSFPIWFGAVAPLVFFAFVADIIRGASLASVARKAQQRAQADGPAA